MKYKLYKSYNNTGFYWRVKPAGLFSWFYDSILVGSSSLTISDAKDNAEIILRKKKEAFLDKEPNSIMFDWP